MMKRFLLGTAAFAVLGATANAADLPARAYIKAGVAPIYNWSGFYAGVMGGYAWSDEITFKVVGFPSRTSSSSDLRGGFGGGTIGYNWQAPGSKFVFGVEVDAAAANIRWSRVPTGLAIENKANALGSITGRFGYALDNTLIYAKGGWAWASNEMSITQGAIGSESHFHSGWTLGGGVEWGFARNWSVKAEYMYVDFNTKDYFNLFSLGASLHTVKGGINYHFN
jgi:outer membrane immunogenic protein